MKNLTPILACAATAACFIGCGPSGDAQNEADAVVTRLAERAKAAATADIKPGAELHIYTWCDYIAPTVIQGFEKAFDCKVVVDTFDSNEAMYAKIKAGGTGYDLITPSSYQVAQMAREGMILPFDHARVPNVKKNFDPAFANQILDPSFRFNVPYTVTYTGFMLRKDKLPAGVEADTWSVLENPALKDRISFLDDIREVIGGGLMSLGYSVNSTDPKEIDAAVRQVLKWKAGVRKFDGESYKTEVASGALFLGHGYSTDATQVIVGDEDENMPPRPDIAFVLPREGFSIAFDEFVLAKGGKVPDLAYAFVNYLYDGVVAKENMEFLCGPNPVKPGIDLLDPEYRAKIILSPEILKKGQVLKGFDENSPAMELYNQAWDKIKAVK